MCRNMVQTAQDISLKNTVLNALIPLSKADICTMHPDISPTTVEAVLGAMVRSGRITRLGAGRASRYIKQ